jgi:hypothetical protein
MKKISLVLALTGVVFLTSCSSSGWSCKKRYCNAKQKNKIEQKKNS